LWSTPFGRHHPPQKKNDARRTLRRRREDDAMADFDLVIRGGLLADGLGGEPYLADVAVAGGKIVQVGQVTGRGAEEIDATGRLVTPGFVDVHTHYDGQVVWDERMAPSSFHGVTTVVMGNCGVGFAPVRPADRDRVVELMEGIEDIPGVVLREGLVWAWETFDEYMAVIAGRRFDMDVAAQLPHAPLRVYVMGERACRLEPATEADMAEMRRLAAAAIRAGAVGFSTSRSLNHKSVHGDPTPSLKATEAELLAIAQGMADAGGGILELASEFTRDGRREEFAMLRRVAEATGVTLTFGISQRNSDPEGWREILDLIDQAQADGVKVVGQVAPRPIGALISVEGTTNPFRLSPRYEAVIANGSLAQKVARLRDPAMRETVLAEVAPHVPGPVIGRFGGFERLFAQDGALDYDPPAETSIGAQAVREGRAPIAVLYDRMHEGPIGRTVYYPVNNYSDFSLDPVRAMLAHPHTTPGLGDGGAHVSIISDASFPTYLLSHWARSNRADGFDLGWLVKRQTSDTAALVGMTDRGVVAPGYKADLNVIDLERLALEPPVMSYDLPSGGRRLLQRARGYVATIVSGEVVSREGQPTGALPGRLVKNRAAVA
jgi:N-acyl-D-aspartate/D-glutamate deacylase